MAPEMQSKPANDEPGENPGSDPNTGSRFAGVERTFVMCILEKRGSRMTRKPYSCTVASALPEVVLVEIPLTALLGAASIII
jgi:hypothetical protein